LWLTCHENRVYTSNFDSNSISVIEADQHSPNYDAVIRTISGGPNGPPINGPKGTTFDNHGRMWVANSGLNSVTVFEKKDVADLSFQSFQTVEPNAIPQPSGSLIEIAYSSASQRVYVVDFNGKAIHSIEARGLSAPIRHIPVLGRPIALDIDKP